MAPQELGLSIERRFLLELSSVPKETQRRAARVLESIRTSSGADIKALTGVAGVYRARCGNYRILFIQGDGWVHAYSIQHRQGVYGGAVAAPRATPTGDLPDFAATAHPAEQPDDSTPIAYTRDDLRGFGLSEGQVAALITWDGSLDGLTHLSSMNIPDFLTDHLLDQLVTSEPTAPSPTSRNVRLITSDVLDSFFRPLVSGLRRDHPIEELVIVSPWITPWESRHSSLRGVCNFIRRLSVPTYVVTRPPDFPAHERALEQLAALSTTEITLLADLHAKYYVCDLAPRPVALLSSANSTQASFSNTEVGVFVDGTGDLEGFVRDLQHLTTELRAASSVRDRR